jgi:hypothetical protein
MKRDFNIHQWQAKYLREFTEPRQDLITIVEKYFSDTQTDPEEQLEELLLLQEYCENKIEELNSPL